jgi:hypothetical protein
MVKLAAFLGTEGVYFRQFKGLFATDNGVIFRVAGRRPIMY